VTVFEPKGSGALGIPWAEIDAKYRALLPAAGLGADEIETSLQLIRELNDVPEIKALTQAIAGTTPKPNS
jgi:hypothetical protein